jgi:hypothetical protein
MDLTGLETDSEDEDVRDLLQEQTDVDTRTHISYPPSVQSDHRRYAKKASIAPNTNPNANTGTYFSRSPAVLQPHKVNETQEIPRKIPKVSNMRQETAHPTKVNGGGFKMPPTVNIMQRDYLSCASARAVNMPVQPVTKEEQHMGPNPAFQKDQEQEIERQYEGQLRAEENRLAAAKHKKAMLEVSRKRTIELDARIKAIREETRQHEAEIAKWNTGDADQEELIEKTRRKEAEKTISKAREEAFMRIPKTQQLPVTTTPRVVSNNRLSEFPIENSRTATKTPAQRRKELAESTQKQELRKPLGYRESELKAIAASERAVEQENKQQPKRGPRKKKKQNLLREVEKDGTVSTALEPEKFYLLGVAISKR